MGIVTCSARQRSKGSIGALVAGAEITRSGFFHHFPDNNALAQALIERYIEQDRVILDSTFQAPTSSATTRWHSMLIALKPFAEMLANLPNGHPDCIVAADCYQERLFERTAARHPPRDPVDLVALADMISTTVEGGIVMAKVLGDPGVLAGQVMLQRSSVKMLFSPGA